MHHDHTYHEGCGCGCGEHHGHHHGHEHAHGCGCGCGEHHHAHSSHQHLGEWDGSLEWLGEQAVWLLCTIRQYGHLPVARFVLRSAEEEELEMTALAPVAVNAADEGMETVKPRAEALQLLADKGLITLDYDIPIADYDYDGYRRSVIFAQLEEAAREAKGREGFLFNVPAMELGSMAIAEAGIALLDRNHKKDQ